MQEKHPGFGQRHILAIWLFTAIINVYILRNSINVAIVSMVNDTKADGEGSDNSVLNDSCPIEDAGNTSSTKTQGEFEWDHATQGLILSAFYYGYICTPFISGYLVRIIGARLLLAIGIGGTAVLTLLNPIATQGGPGFLVALRVIEGFLEGVTFPCNHYLLGNWAPQQERSILVSFPASGQNFGTVIAAPLTGLLCQYVSWQSSFYIFGGIGILWSIGWYYFVRNTPAEHPTISPEERAYIEKNCQSSSKTVAFRDVPWKQIALSPAAWALLVAHTTYHWNFYTLLTEMSTYLKDVLHIGEAMNGLVTALPYVCIWVVQIFAAFFSDFLRAKGIKTIIVRKMCFSGGLMLSGVFLIVLSYVGCDAVTVVSLLCLSVGFCGFAISGYIVNHLDIAPQYASILIGVTNTIASIPGIVSPLLAGAITNEQSTITTWRTVFFISAGISAFGAIVFAIFGDGEVQPWAKVIEDTPDERTDLLKSAKSLQKELHDTSMSKLLVSQG